MESNSNHVTEVLPHGFRRLRYAAAVDRAIIGESPPSVLNGRALPGAGSASSD
ncbi:hypothetical protein [Candidatus Poriferisodalis sp.]|uniref:hypothetical protein n=1 Tax=Candidatus Poriferisodalis sp. TaxID=3101277 RepID=UPI003B01C30A